MIIASRSAALSHSTDPIAQSVRSFIAPSSRLESHAQAESSSTGELNLARLYPSIFNAPARPSFAIRSARTASAALSGAAAAIAVIAGVLHH